MKWSLQQLYKYRTEPLLISGIVNYDEYVENIGDLLHMDEVRYSGKAVCVDYEKYEFSLNIKTTMYLEDAWTLEEVPYEIDISVIEVFGKDPKNEDERYIEKNTIDLYDVIWENILLEMPIRIVKA